MYDSATIHAVIMICISTDVIIAILIITYAHRNFVTK